MTLMPLTPARIIIGGIYNIRNELQHEALGYQTGITLPARHHMVLVIGNNPDRPGYWNIMTLTTSVQNLNDQPHEALRTRFVNFIPFAPHAEKPYGMQLTLLNDATLRYDSYLRIDKPFFIHESGLTEMLECITSKQYGAHLRVPLEGEGGMERLIGVLERRKELVRRVEGGEEMDAPTLIYGVGMYKPTIG